jgi:hypothetical protein
MTNKIQQMAPKTPVFSANRPHSTTFFAPAWLGHDFPPAYNLRPIQASAISRSSAGRNAFDLIRWPTWQAVLISTLDSSTPGPGDEPYFQLHKEVS